MNGKKVSPTSRLTARKIKELEELLSRPGIKAKTSVSISREILAAADLLAGKISRSAVFERALESYVWNVVRAARDEIYVERVNANAKAINREAQEVMRFQSWPE